MVEFRFGNLLDLPTEVETELRFMDLIMCRNVFIYFNTESIARVISRFSDLLNEGGYLITGHGELFNQSHEIRHLTVTTLPESIFYQKTSKSPSTCYLSRHEQEPLRINTEGLAHKRVSSLETGKNTVAGTKEKLDRKKIAPTAATVNSELNRIFLLGDYVSVIKLGEEIVKDNLNDLRTLQLLANAYANIGLLEKAQEKCWSIIELDSASINSYFLLATIAEAVGNNEQAKDLLKKVIYLDSTFVAAYLELGGLYERENDRQRASKMRQTALELLKARSPDTLIEPYKDMTAGELIQHITEKPV
jgi:chemotaxis protein methyltransferase CheR